MSKIRSDSIWNSLPPEQRQKLEHWLFVERVSFQVVKERAEKEWGVTGSVVGLSKFYHRVEGERVADELETAAETAARMEGTEGKLENLQASAMKVMGMRLLQNTVSRGDVKELAVLNRALARNEERKILNRRLDLAQRKFEFNAAKAVLNNIALLEKITKDEQEREDAKIEAIRLAIFGTPPTDVIYEY